jgi:hypothetical protein
LLFLVINNLKNTKMRNARKELEGQLTRRAKIKCALIEKSDGYDPGCYNFEESFQKFKLKVNHTEEELESFLKSLDFEYDSGYGSQELFGTVWLEDGTWFTRGEYDGSEWWEYHKLPEIPAELL